MSPEEQLDKFLRSVAAAAAAGSNLDEVVVEDDYAVVQKPASKVKAGPGSSGWRSMDSLGRYSMPRRKVMNHFKVLSKSYESKFVKRCRFFSYSRLFYFDIIILLVCFNVKFTYRVEGQNLKIARTRELVVTRKQPQLSLSPPDHQANENGPTSQDRLPP